MAFNYRKLSPAQIRAARGMINWTQEKLETESGLSIRTIQNIENEVSKPMPRTLRDLCETFENAGIEFLNGDQPGLRLAGKE